MCKVNKNVVFLILMTSSFFLLVACGKDEETAEELIRYHNDHWTEIIEKRNEALDVSLSKFIQLEDSDGKKAVKKHVENVILADFEEFLDYEVAIDIDNDSVKELHELLVEADEAAYNTLKDKGEAYYNGEINENEFIEAAEDTEKLYDEFYNYREKLMKKNKLAIDHVMNDDGAYEEIMMDESKAKNVDSIKWGTQ